MAGADFKAYGTIETYDAYWAVRGVPAAWAAAAPEQKAVAGLEASEYLDLVYGHLFPGRRLRPVTEQAREFPRDYPYPVEVDPVTGVPPALCHATAYLAARYVEGDRFLEDVDPGIGGGGGALTGETLRVGSVSIAQTFSEDAPASANNVRFYPRVEQMLESAGLFGDIGRMERG
ncbi:MAG: DnaT-like ssDNA-binding protein [Planctomycetota bacterium]